MDPVPRVTLACALLLFAGLAGCAQPEAAPSSLLHAAAVEPTGVVREFDLHVAAGHDLAVAGVWPFTFRFVGTDGADAIPGPEIRVKQGDTVRVRLHDGWHTIHWHGVRVPWGMDGVPDMTQTLGDGVFTYEFVAMDAGTFWYHCHVAPSEHIDLGMFGAFIVEPAEPRADPPFDREATLFLHEMDLGTYAVLDAVEPTANTGTPPRVEMIRRAPGNAFDLPDHAAANAEAILDVYAGGAQDAAWPHADIDRGYRPRYDTFLINGKSFPETDPVTIATGETLRIRLVNAGQLPHTMHLHGHRFLVTHKDGALLPAPYLADTIGLFPGERYDVYVFGDNPGHWDFHDHGGAWGAGAYASAQGWTPGGMQTMLVYDDWEPPSKLPAPVESALRARAPPERTAADPHAGHAGHAPTPARGGAAPAARLPIALGLLA